jgi:hypothetical protein
VFATLKAATIVSDLVAQRMTITLHRLTAIAIQKTRGLGCWECDLRPSPDEFYKRKSQEKHLSCGWIFSSLSARVNERGWF